MSTVNLPRELFFVSSFGNIQEGAEGILLGSRGGGGSGECHTVLHALYSAIGHF